MNKIFIPNSIAKFCHDRQQINIESGIMVKQILPELLKKAPMLKKYLISSDGNLLNYVKLFIDEKDSSQYVEDAILENSEIHFVIAHVGG